MPTSSRAVWVVRCASGSALAAIGIHVLALACNEPPATSYGNPNTVDRNNLPGEGGAAPLDCTGDAAPGPFDGGDCPSFATDIHPNIVATGKWRCSDPTCHGGTSLPNIASGEPGAMLAALKAITIAGVPYLPDGPGDAGGVSMLCNLQGTCGDRMPEPPGVDPLPSELCVVQAWLTCGAPP